MNAARAEDHIAEDTGPVQMCIMHGPESNQAVNGEIAKALAIVISIVAGAILVLSIVPWSTAIVAALSLSSFVGIVKFTGVLYMYFRVLVNSFIAKQLVNHFTQFVERAHSHRITHGIGAWRT